MKEKRKMAETNNPSGGESTTNTTSVTTGGSTTGGRGTTNTSTTTRGGDVDSTGTLSSANTPDANLESESKVQVAAEGTLLPYPHTALANLELEATVYRDLIKDVYKEHEKELDSDKVGNYEPTPEMLAARDDAQVRLADELRASLKAQRSMSARNSGKEEGGVKIKLSKPHIHNGIAYQAGDEISVDEASAKFIEEVKAGKKSE
jgi:hypothetical protein